MTLAVLLDLQRLGAMVKNSTLLYMGQTEQARAQNPHCMDVQRKTKRKIPIVDGVDGARSSWISMRGRCLYPTTRGYKNYGGRGIKVCARWGKFKNFLADMGERPAGASIDRINNDGDYEPGNCRWASREMQCRHWHRQKTSRSIIDACLITPEQALARASWDQIAKQIALKGEAFLSLPTDTSEGQQQ